jgi:hypothetical protein
MVSDDRDQVHRDAIDGHGRLRDQCRKARDGAMTSFRRIKCQQRARHDKQEATNQYLCWSPAIAYGHAIPGDP